MEEPKNAEDEEDELDESVQGTQLPAVNEDEEDELDESVQLTQLPRVPAVEISRNGGDTQVLHFEGDAEQKIDIGRRAGASDKVDKIILTGEGVEVSRCHAQLKCLPDGRVLVVTSSPFVFVNGTVLPTCAEGTQRFLDQGDEITVGSKRLCENTVKVVTCAPAHQNIRSAEAEERRATAATEHRRQRPGPDEGQTTSAHIKKGKTHSGSKAERRQRERGNKKKRKAEQAAEDEDNVKDQAGKGWNKKARSLYAQWQATCKGAGNGLQTLEDVKVALTKYEKEEARGTRGKGGGRAQSSQHHGHQTERRHDRIQATGAKAAKQKRGHRPGYRNRDAHRSNTSGRRGGGGGRGRGGGRSGGGRRGGRGGARGGARGGSVR